MLNGSQQKELHNALMSAFPTYLALEKMLLFELDKHLEEIVGGTNLSDSVFILIREALAQGWLEDLVFAAHDSNPRNQLLFDFFKRFYLKSNRNVDYTRLRHLLRARNWQDADEETYRVMLKVVGRESGDWIRPDELLNFSCTDLRTIDTLWVKYTSGRFGFSVQKKIYLQVGGKPDGKYYKEAWEKFGDRVGWRVNQDWIEYEQITFDTTAPVGHLPVRYCRFVNGVWNLFSRIQTCKV